MTIAHSPAAYLLSNPQCALEALLAHQEHSSQATTLLQQKVGHVSKVSPMTPCQLTACLQNTEQGVLNNEVMTVA